MGGVIFNSNIKTMRIGNINMKLVFSEEELNSIVKYFQRCKKNKTTDKQNIEDFVKDIIMLGVKNDSI